MRRRHFIKLLAAAALTWPRAANAQQATKMPRVGILSPNRSEGPDPSLGALNALVTGLRELGYNEGQNIVFERRFGESNPDRLRDRAAELVGLKVDIIAALSTTAARAARQATGTIPI